MAKLEMRKDTNLWVTFGEMDDMHGQNAEVIIDRKKKDVRIRLGNEILKVVYDQKGLKAIILNDIYIHRRRIPVVPKEKASTCPHCGKTMQTNEGASEKQNGRVIIWCAYCGQPYSYWEDL